MYYYVIKDTWTGETLAEGTAVQLVESGKYVSAESVSNAYNGWRRRKEKHGESRVEWVRTGERNRTERKKPAPQAKKTGEARLHTSHPVPKLAGQAGQGSTAGRRGRCSKAQKAGQIHYRETG